MLQFFIIKQIYLLLIDMLQLIIKCNHHIHFYNFYIVLHILQGKLSEVARIMSAVCILIYIKDCQLF